MKHFSRARGFTMVEILVVLAIVALLSSILFTAFKSVSQGNKKSSCQTNLTQIYQATRLYAQDFNGELPYYNPSVVASSATTPSNGLGLWALYGYPASDNLDCDGRTSQLPSPTASSDTTAPLASYIKSPRFFHCPFDSFSRAALGSSGCGVAAGTQLKTDVLQYDDAGGNARLNPFYLSYQVADTDAPYSSFRADGSKRQLLYYKTVSGTAVPNQRVRSADTTIITWCRFHRQLDASGNTVANAGNYDNVLFLDGSVQYIPTTQNVNGTDLEGWQRYPLEVADCLNSGGTACNE